MQLKGYEISVPNETKVDFTKSGYLILIIKSTSTSYICRNYSCFATRQKHFLEEANCKMCNYRAVQLYSNLVWLQVLEDVEVEHIYILGLHWCHTNLVNDLDNDCVIARRTVLFQRNYSNIKYRPIQTQRLLCTPFRLA